LKNVKNFTLQKIGIVLLKIKKHVKNLSRKWTKAIKIINKN
jgi:hypothetical protein